MVVLFFSFFGGGSCGLLVVVVVICWWWWWLFVVVVALKDECADSKELTPDFLCRSVTWLLLVVVVVVVVVLVVLCGVGARGGDGQPGAPPDSEGGVLQGAHAGQVSHMVVVVVVVCAAGARGGDGQSGAPADSEGRVRRQQGPHARLPVQVSCCCCCCCCSFPQLNTLRVTCTCTSSGTLRVSDCHSFQCWVHCHAAEMFSL